MLFIKIALSALTLCATAVVAQRDTAGGGGGGSGQNGGGPTSVTPGSNPTSNPSFAQFLAFILSLQAGGNGGDSGRPQRRDVTPLDARQDVKGASAGSWEAPSADLSGQLQDIIKWISSQQWQQPPSAGQTNSGNAGGWSKLARRQEWEELQNRINEWLAELNRAKEEYVQLQMSENANAYLAHSDAAAAHITGGLVRRQEWQGMSAVAAQELQDSINEWLAEINRTQEEYQRQQMNQNANYAASDAAAAGMWGKLARRQDWQGMSSMSSQQLQNTINELLAQINNAQGQYWQQMQQAGATYANADAAGNAAWSKLARRQFNGDANLDPNSPQTQELQAKIAAIQAADKALEMESKRIDTQHMAVQTEIDEITKALNRNIETAFGLFGRQQGDEATAMRVRRQRYARNV